jgi:asparagine synthase (glutamine-hydrolysing)
MCGICGQYNFRDGAPVFRRDIERMAQSIAHRGPDDEGYYISGPLGLGFRRLSIIDLAGGHQPMSDAEESVWVVFNGEIYNFPELKQELESHGHIFRTRSDTEVIVHGYKRWGDDVLNHLNGMFGLAIWDIARKRLVLARDPFGIKLIYYRLHDGCLYFGSEIRAVLAGVGERPAADPNSLNLFLRFRFAPSPHTIFRGVCKLAPGSMLVCENGTSSVRHWYRYRPTPFVPPKSDEEVQENLLELYKQSMKRHLLSDVPVGLLLSGGVDSGLLLALMNLYGSEWRTYTVGYGATFSDDELSDAERTASHFSAKHTAVLLDRRTFEETLPQIVSCLEEPIAASSIVPMYFVCKRAREDVKVVLIGQGPDELFGGYRRHLGIRYSSYWGAIPEWMRSPLELALSRLPRNEMLKRGLYSLKVRNRTERYQQVLSILPGEEIDSLFEDGLLDGDAGEMLIECWKDLLPLSDQTDELGGFQFLEMRSTLPDELLMYADKLSMAHGLEGRVPYLDRELVEYVERLPQKFKVRLGARKWAHRRVCAEFLPAEILKRKKRGFAVNVVDEWFRGAMNTRMTDIFLDSASLMYQYLQPAAVQRVFRQHQAGQSDHYKILFSLVVFEQWLRVHSFQDPVVNSVLPVQVANAV